MKKYLICAFLVFTISGAFFIAFLKPILVRPLLGSGRVLSPPIDAEVRVNGNARPNFLCYRTTAFSDPSIEMIVIYDTEKNEHEYNDVMVIDVTEREAGLPNASVNDYFLLWDPFLFQSESGAAWVPYSSPKFDHNPNYVFEPNYIRFDVPSRTGIETVETLLKDN